MAWPPSGTNGWEAFGTEITTEPERWPLPVVRVGYYFDPTRLNGVGALAQDSIVLTYHGGTVVVRRRSGSAEAEFRLPYVWSDGLLDTMVIEDYDPCAIVADIYADDRETILWSVGTSPRHPNPYLMEPERYAEQEIDPAAGAATLGTVTLTIVDKAQTAGDQDSGWMTAKLAEVGIANLAGRRVRVRRFVSPDLPPYVLADGPASAPRLDQYAAFTFDVRDTRETERKVRLFDSGIEQVLLPEGPINGFGSDGDGGWLVPPTGVATGLFTQLVPPFASGFIALVGYTSDADRTISSAAYHTIQRYAPDFSVTDPLTWVNRGPIWVQWREAGSDDPWVEVRASLALSLLPEVLVQPWDFASGTLPEGPDAVIDSVVFGVAPEDPSVMPANGQTIEFRIFGPRGVPPTPEYPIYLDGVTAGEFARDVYRGLYSPRAPDGAIVPTGIRYDEAALLQMTDVLRVRFTEVIDDARDWLEKFLYAPTGWIPALDDLGQISPVSQVPPLSGDGLLAVTDAITEASSEWSAGERVVNVLRFVYPRLYLPTDPELAGPDGLASRSVLIEFVDPASVERYGRQVLEMQGEAFAAVGDGDAEALVSTVSESAYLLAQARQMYVQARYAFGAPAISVAVMRRMTTGLRAGSWVVVDLSWLPDYITQRRGLIGLGQVVALGDLDCAWRQVLLEMVTPLALPAS